jgi:hypothetical protein
MLKMEGVGKCGIHPRSQIRRYQIYLEIRFCRRQNVFRHYLKNLRIGVVSAVAAARKYHDQIKVLDNENVLAAVA